MKLGEIFENVMNDLQYVLDTFYVFDELNNGDVIIEENSTEKYRIVVHNNVVVNVIPWNNPATQERADEILDKITRGRHANQ